MAHDSRIICRIMPSSCFTPGSLLWLLNEYFRFQKKKSLKMPRAGWHPTDAAIGEMNLVFLLKLEPCALHANCFPLAYIQQVCTCVQQQRSITFSKMALLFKTENQDMTNILVNVWCIMGLWYIHTTKHHKAIKMNKISLPAEYSETWDVCRAKEDRGTRTPWEFLVKELNDKAWWDLLCDLGFVYSYFGLYIYLQLLLF